MNKTALVTGARKGLGRALCEALLADGYAVAGCSRKEGDLEHPGYRHFICDVGEPGQVTALFRNLRREWGRLDVLINNAGIASMNHFLLSTAEAAERLYRTNALGPFYTMREAAKLMRKHGGGRIVNFTTVAAALDLEGEALYASSKAALESLTRIAAREFAPFGITVNAVGPTPVETDLIRAVPKDKIAALVERQAVKRLGTPKDVINVVRFFLKEESDFVTGQILYLGGVRG